MDMDGSENTFKSIIEEYSVPCLCETLQVFPGVELSQFNPLNLSKVLGDRTLRWRIGKRQSPDLQWEHACSYKYASIQQVMDWNGITNCKEATLSQKVLQDIISACCSKHYWCYADYMYMKNLFHDHHDLMNKLKWSELGFVNKTGNDSTIWIGTAGAHTLCHYDTYGYNIVVQIFGSKRWILFPPSDMEALYPTRIPYEESSVFSEVNLGNPDLSQHPKFRTATACSVILRPGDILYVPRHWWHYVENLELSVSFNLWCDVESDAGERFRESITRVLVSAMSPMMPPQETWLTPTEDADSVMCVEESLKYLNQSLKHINSMVTGEPTSQHANSQRIYHRNKGSSNPIFVKPLKLTNFMDSSYFDLVRVISGSMPSHSGLQKMDFTVMDLVKHLTHPDHISAFAKFIRRHTTENCSQASEHIERGVVAPLSNLCENANVDSMVVNKEYGMEADKESTVANPMEISSSSPSEVKNSTYNSSATNSLGGKSPSQTQDTVYRNTSSVASNNESLISVVEIEGIDSDSSDGLLIGFQSVFKNFGSLVHNFPLETRDGVENLELQLSNEKNFKTLVNMITVEDAKSINEYLDFVMSELFAKSVIAQFGITSRNSTFSVGENLIRAMLEALKRNKELIGKQECRSESSLRRSVRLWLSARRRETLGFSSYKYYM